MQDFLNKALEAAERDWRANVGEHDRPSLDRMFQTSGFARQAPRQPDAKVPDWCGMAVGTWLVEGGLNAAFARSFLHCLNVEAFFTYGRSKNVNPRRLDRSISVGEGRWLDIEAFHRGSSSPMMRLWADRATLSAGVDDDYNAAALFQPGDVVLMDWSGRDAADHITMVHRWDGRTLVTIEGNATGGGPDGERRRDAVVIRRTDLSNSSERGAIYGRGRLSPMDFCTNPVKP
jgi:hypothetical protein